MLSKSEKRSYRADSIKVLKGLEAVKNKKENKRRNCKFKSQN